MMKAIFRVIKLAWLENTASKQKDDRNKVGQNSINDAVFKKS